MGEFWAPALNLAESQAPDAVVRPGPADCAVVTGAGELANGSIGRWTVEGCAQ
jgi:hypothetical protein